MAETQTQTPPVVDPKVLQPIIMDSLKTVIADAQRESMAAAQAQAEEQARRDAEAAQQDTTGQPLRKVLLDEIGGDLQNNRLIAQSAADLAKFYAQHPEAREHSPEIERKFEELMSVGRPTNRETLWQWYRGVNFDKFYQLRKEQEAMKKAEAEGAIMPTGSGSGGRGSSTFDPFTATPDDINEFLKGKEF